MAISPPGKALQGVKVLDLTQFEAGTSITQALAWYGADVVKIEEPTKGDQGRSASTNLQGVDSHYFIVLNCNKRSATLNLRDERGKQMLREMVGKADIFVENFAPGAIERLGFSYETVRALNPGIIYTQMKGFRSGSPSAKYLSFDMIAQAMGGTLSITGSPETTPIRPGPTIGDTGAGLHALVAIQAALLQKRLTGCGQRIEVGMQETTVNYCRTAFAHHHTLGGPPPRLGNRDPLGRTAPSNVYPCRPFGPNDYCYIGCEAGDGGQWERLATAIGRPELLTDARFSTAEARAANADQLDQVIGEWTRERTKQETMELLGEAGVPAGAVLDTMELFSDPHLRRQGMFVALQHPVRGEMVVPGWPVKLSDSPVEMSAAPLLGQQSSEIYQEWLGLDEPRIEQLRAEGVI